MLGNSLGLMPAVLQTKNSIIKNVKNIQINPKIQQMDLDDVIKMEERQNNNGQNETVL